MSVLLGKTNEWVQQGATGRASNRWDCLLDASLGKLDAVPPPLPPVRYSLWSDINTDPTLQLNCIRRRLKNALSTKNVLYAHGVSLTTPGNPLE